MLIVGPSIAMSTTSDTGQKTVVPLTIPVVTPLALGEDLYRLLLHLSSGIPLLRPILLVAVVQVLLQVRKPLILAARKPLVRVPGS